MSKLKEIAWFVAAGGLIATYAVLMFVMLVANPRTLGACLALSLCFAVFGVLVGVLPNWNWWGYSTAYVGGQIGELIVGWALVGLVLAKVMGNGTSSDD